MRLGGTVSEGIVTIRNLVKKVYFTLVEKQRRSDRVYGRIAPALVEEASRLVQKLKVIQVGLASEEIQVGNFEIRPLYRKG